MIPVRISGATHQLGPPEGWSPEQGRCAPLAVRCLDGVFSSAWEPTPDELAKLVAGGTLVLHIVGGQPPVAITVEEFYG